MFLVLPDSDRKRDFHEQTIYHGAGTAFVFRSAERRSGVIGGTGHRRRRYGSGKINISPALGTGAS
jgi:hypothetical protein